MFARTVVVIVRLLFAFNFSNQFSMCGLTAVCTVIGFFCSEFVDELFILFSISPSPLVWCCGDSNKGVVDCPKGLLIFLNLSDTRAFFLISALSLLTYYFSPFYCQVFSTYFFLPFLDHFYVPVLCIPIQNKSPNL